MVAVVSKATLGTFFLSVKAKLVLDLKYARHHASIVSPGFPGPLLIEPYSCLA